MDDFYEINEIRDDANGETVKLPFTIRLPKGLFIKNDGRKSERRLWFYVAKELCKKIEVQNG